MTPHPATPVVVAAAAVTHHPGDGFVATSATALMMEAARRALDAIGPAGEALGRAVGEVLVPHGTWPEPDPGRAVAASVGAASVRSVQGELGVLQHTLLARAATAVAEGAVEVALVAGGENRWSGVVAAKTGAAVPDAPAGATAQPPDEVLRPSVSPISSIEIERNLTTAAHQYAIIESALRHHAGRSSADHLRHLGQLWARFAAVAAATPSAWDRRGLSADEIITVSDTNRLLAAPYPKWLVSQWNVDQSAALFVTTAGTAERLGVPREQWVFPLAMVESNAVVTLPERAELHRWPALEVCGARALDAAGIDLDAVGPVDLYSCFPAAVQVAAAELSLGLDRDLTLTGGMTFGGGPYDNYVLQAVVAMVERLRDEPTGTVGLTSAVSGLLTKPGVVLWSTDGPSAPAAVLDVSAEADAATARRPVAADATGPGVLAGHTVVPGRDGALTAVAVIDVPGPGEGARTVAQCTDPAIAARLLDGDHVGHRVTVTEPGAFVPGVS